MLVLESIVEMLTGIYVSYYTSAKYVMMTAREKPQKKSSGYLTAAEKFGPNPKYIKGIKCKKATPVKGRQM